MPVFVFGSNLAGRHGKGAALAAREAYGAETGVGEGRTGDAYALPTKDEKLCVLPPERLREGIDRFLEYARANPTTLFLLTPVGCGLAGNPVQMVIAFLLRTGRLPENILLTATWLDHVALRERQNEL